MEGGFYFYLFYVALAGQAILFAGAQKVSKNALLFVSH